MVLKIILDQSFESRHWQHDFHTHIDFNGSAIIHRMDTVSMKTCLGRLGKKFAFEERLALGGFLDLYNTIVDRDAISTTHLMR